MKRNECVSMAGEKKSAVGGHSDLESEGIMRLRKRKTQEVSNGSLQAGI